MNPTEKNIWLLIDFSLVFGFMGVIIFASSRPMPAFFVLPVTHIDKLYHFGAFLVFGVCLARLGFRLTGSIFWALWAAVVIGTTFGISDEFHQMFVPGRFDDWGDIAADAVGSVAGGLLWWALWGRRAAISLTTETN